MLFQMCYGPEIPALYKIIAKNSGCTKQDLLEIFQYREEGNIESLIDAVLKFLEQLGFISEQDRRWFAQLGDWNIVCLLKQLSYIARNSSHDSYNYMFSTLYEKLFVQKNTLFIHDLHTQSNLLFANKGIGREKLNAWKRMMEFFGLGYRVYSGFYALPHPFLLHQLIQDAPSFDGTFQTYCETHLQPIIPCVSDGHVFDGMFFGLLEMNRRGIIRLSLKQDLPSPSYGKEQKYNWITINKGGKTYGSMPYA